MKNILISGLLIGLLSGTWLLLLYLIGYLTFLDDLVTLLVSGKPFRDRALLLVTAICIPAIGLTIGLLRHKRRCGGQMAFWPAFFTGLKILITGGLIAGLLALLLLHQPIKGTYSSFAALSGALSAVGLVIVVILSLALCSRK